MSSYKHDGRIPRPRDIVPQCRDTSPSSEITVISTTSDVSVSHPPEPQLARPVNPPRSTVRALSFSTGEEPRPLQVPSTLPGSSPLHHARQSLLPRPASQSLPLKSHCHPASPLPIGRSMHQPSGHPMNNPRTLPNKILEPEKPRPRYALRRKAPTIGQHAENDSSRTEAARPEKLCVIIPSNPTPDRVRTATPHTPCQYMEPGKQSSSQNVNGVNTGPMAEFPPGQGPKELASLRTTISTQNLPPPTPAFPTTGSPSTRYSSSPGIWSRTSTPTSLSSCSPGIVHPVKVGRHVRQPNSPQTILPMFSPSVPSVRSSPLDRAEVSVRNSPNLPKKTQSSLSPLNTELGGPVLVKDSKPSSTTSDTSRRKLPTGSNLPKRVNSDTEVQNQTDAAERSVFDRPKVTRTKTADALADTALPSRPSREGTHRLELEPSPIVKSNLLPHSVTSHKRRVSTENLPTLRRPAPSPVQSAAKSADSFESQGSSRIPPRKTTSPVLLKKPRRTLSKENKQAQETKPPEKTRRFGLFPRKSKADLGPEQTKPARKGPAAGTGHEGYGKYGQSGRRASVSSNGSGGRSVSTVGSRAKTESSSIKGNGRNRSDVELDEFLLDRLEPVVISGGGMDGAALMRMQSAESASGLSTASSSMGEPPKPQHPTNRSTNSAATSTGMIDKPVMAEPSTSRTARPKGETRRWGSDSDSGEVPKSRMVAGKDKSSLRSTKSNVWNPFPDSRNSSITALPQSTALIYPQCHGDATPNVRKAQSQKGKGRKWNFFQRSRGTDQKHSAPDVANPPTTPKLPSKVSPVSTNRPVAHYAIVDGDSDPLEDIFQRIEDSPPTEDEDIEVKASDEALASLDTRKMHESILLPSPPQIQSEFLQGGLPSTKVFFNKDPPHASLEMDRENKRRSRLESIGRIPQVISRRDREHKPAQESFSRPFSVTDTPNLAAPAGVRQNSHQTLSRGIKTSSPPRHPRRLGYDLTQPFGDPIQQSALDFLAGPYFNDQFLSFSQDSQYSSSSESGGLSAVTTINPSFGTELTADEVWGEYDDLVDHFSPETPMSAGRRHPGLDENFQMATAASKALQSELDDRTDKCTPPVAIKDPAGALNGRPSGSTDNNFHLRRSKTISELHSPLLSSSQPSYSDIIAAYQESGESADTRDIDRMSTPRQTLLRQSSVLIPPFSAASQDFELSRRRNTVLFDIAERDRDGPTVQTNLRSGSLMTSRWLSFGRVLFSPAHNHAKSREQERILVIDGLGNDDWSFYCSLTYPRAEVYSLIIGQTPAASSNPAAWQPPTNHHTIHHASLECALPFPKGFFAVAVLRFPSACSENVQDNIVSECKRILRPGGYMEMSILDLDMVNMGIRTRKAVRRLKEQTYLADATISLKPASDSIQRLLGRYGFDNLRRCMVQVPTAGMIVRSSGSSTSSSSNHASTPKPPSTAPRRNQTTQNNRSLPYPEETNISLGDLLSDPCPSATNDESIRKIVAKVGRWWYTRCYEIPVLPDGDIGRSIWADKRVLRECQKGGTGFRLLIAYAQKPSEKRRTASV